MHRGYCQIKVFCEKGAERKMRGEERRKGSLAPAQTSNDDADSGSKHLMHFTMVINFGKIFSLETGILPDRARF